MNENDKFKRDFYDELSSLSDLYDKVKKAILLCEQFDPEREMPVAPMNQLRSALDHIFKAIHQSSTKPDECKKELEEVAEHMRRAGYDALDVLVSSLWTDIPKRLEPYNNEALSAVFPEYYKSIKYRITQIQASTDPRARIVDTNEGFKAHYKRIIELISISEIVDTKILGLEEYKARKDKEHRETEEQLRQKEINDSKKQRQQAIAVGGICAVAGTFIGGLLLWLFQQFFG